MLVVADTTPLNYLIQIGHVDVLRRLYGRVVLPVSVLRELADAGAPHQVRSWATAPPVWIQSVSAGITEDSELNALGQGERDAILVSVHLGADRLLMDELKGRAAAERRGIVLTGTLAVLRDGAAEGCLDFDIAVNSLLRLGFRASAEVVRRVRRG